MEGKKIISSVGLNVVDSQGYIRTLPLYTQKTDFNRAKAWTNFKFPFTLQDTTNYINMRAVYITDTNYTGSSMCNYMYSPTTSISRGLAIWVREPSNDNVLSHKVEIIGWTPETNKTKAQLNTTTVVLPKGMYAGTARCYLFGQNIGVFTDSEPFGAPAPDFKFYHEDGKYDLLTYRGYYKISTQGGESRVYESGSVNNSGGNTYYYGSGSWNRNELSISTSHGDTASENRPLKNSSGYRDLSSGSGYNVSVAVGYRHYDELYLPIVEKQGHVATSLYIGTRVEILYFNEDFIVTNCSGTMDYTGTINCPHYGTDCVSQTMNDDIFGEGYYCATGQTITRVICSDETLCSSQTCTGVTQSYITKCESSACQTQTITDANIVPDCTVQKSYDDGNVSTLPDPNDIPAVDSWTDPNACSTQTDQFGNYCDVDGPNSVTCLGRADMDGNRLPDENTIDNWEIYVVTIGGESQKYIKDNSTGKYYCENLTTGVLDDDGNLAATKKAKFAEVDENWTIRDNLPAEGISIDVVDDGGAVILDSTTLPDGSVRTTLAEDKGGGVTEVWTTIRYPNGDVSRTSRMVDEDGTVIGVSFTDRNGNTTYCESDTCTTNTELFDLWYHPTVEKACSSLTATVTVPTIESTGRGESGETEPVMPVGSCTNNTMTVTIDGVTTEITWINGVPVDKNSGQTIPSISTECSNGQTQTVIPTDNGDIDIQAQDDNTMTYTMPGCSSQTYTVISRPGEGTVTIAPDGTTTVEYDDNIGQDYPATCWGSKSTGEICGGINNPSSGYCEVGAGHQ